MKLLLRYSCTVITFTISLTLLLSSISSTETVFEEVANGFRDLTSREDKFAVATEYGYLKVYQTKSERKFSCTTIFTLSLFTLTKVVLDDISSLSWNHDDKEVITLSSERGEVYSVNIKDNSSTLVARTEKVIISPLSLIEIMTASSTVTHEPTFQVSSSLKKHFENF